MSLFIDRCRANVRPARIRATQPRVEGLEDRLLLFATSGGAWAYPVRVTYSFVPDGTSMGGTPTNLFSTFNNIMSQATWQADIEKAAALWEGAAHINLVQVSDDGSAIGSGPDQQGASNFGDIRIGGYDQGNGGTLAYAFMPPPLNGGPVAGDIMFNTDSAVNWNPSTGYDLETVAIHEFGHALGLDHSALTTAVMYAYYNGTKQSLTSDDVSGIQAIYGAQTDPTTDKSKATATPLTLGSNDQAILTGLNLSGPTDAQWYSVVVPADTNGTLTIQMQTTNLSSLEPRVTLYNSGGTGLKLVSNTTLGGGTATLTYSGVTPGQTYYIRASSASTTIGSAGGFALLVNLGSGTLTPVAPPNTTVLNQPDQGGGSQSDTAGHHHGHKSTHNPADTIKHGHIVGIGDRLTAQVHSFRHGRRP